MVITQNIDELHARAGSKNIIELHGDETLFCTALLQILKYLGLDI